MGIWDRSGFVSVAQNTAIVTGSGTTWLVSSRPGDRITFNAGAKWYEIGSVDSNTQITLVTDFIETSISGGAYAIDPSSYRHQLPSDILERLREVLRGQSDIFEVSGTPSPSLGADKSLAFDPDARVFYRKVAGVWGAAVALGGADGTDAGTRFQFSTATGMADPGTGFVRFNNATRASVTAIAIDDLSAETGNPDVSALVLGWDDSTSTMRGLLFFREIGQSQNYAIFAVTGASTDNAGWTQLAVAHLASGGAFGNNDNLSVSFARTGDMGTPGVNGVSAGPLFTLSTNTSMADPGAGTLRFNNATIASVTQLAVDATSAAAGNPSVAAFVNMWDDSTNTAHRGTLTFTKHGAEQNFAMFSVGGPLTDNTGWLQVPLTYITSGGTFTNGDTLVVQFDRTGNAGANGADGISAGFAFAFSTTTTIADPGTGAVRLNHATPAAVTAIALSSLTAEAGNPSIAAIIASWDDSTNPTHRGTVTFRKLTAKQNFAQYAITADVIDNGSWTELTVAHVGSAGSFSAADVLTVEFVRTGNVGADGDGSVDTVNGQSPTGGAITLNATHILVSAFDPANYSPAGQQVEQHLQGIDSRFASVGVNPNLLVNGDGALNQRGATTAADDTYHVDRWYALTQSAAIGISTVSNAANGVPSLVRLTQSNATAQRMGSAHILESKDSIILRGSPVTFSGKARLSTAANIHFAIVEWTGTADAVTSDWVNNWASGTYTPGNFFTSTSTTVVAVGTLALAANTLTDFSLTGTVSGSATNVAVFIWTTAAVAQTVTLDYRGKLEASAAATAWRAKTAAEELLAAMRYFQVLGNGLPGYVSTAASVRCGQIFPVPMRVAPTPSLGSTSPVFVCLATSQTGSGSTLTTSSVDQYGGRFLIGGFSGLTAGDPAHGSSTAIIRLEAEL